MNLKQKLALRSTMVCAMALALVFTGTYYFFRNDVLNQFYERLQQRALVAAYFYLEKDELSVLNYIEYEKKIVQRLDEEIVQIYNSRNKISFVPNNKDIAIDQEIIDKIRQQGKYIFSKDRRQYVGLFYKDNQGDFVVLVSGINNRGYLQLGKLMYLLLTFYILGIVLNYLMNILVANKTFRPFKASLDKVNTISSENIHDRLPETTGSNDELRQMIDTFNRFLERIETQVQNQKGFLKNISHELNTPLTAIIGRAEVALENPGSDKQAVLHKIINDTYEVRSVIEGLLLLSGLNNDTDKKAITSFRVDDLIWECLEKLKFKYPDAVFHIEIPAEADEEQYLQIRSYKELLSHAITNIIDNAVKYSDEQTVEVFLEIRNGHPLMRIRDQGRGIPPEELAYIEKLFYRASNVTYIPGHGIGLSLARQIMEFCQVSMTLTSTLNEETEVTIVF